MKKPSLDEFTTLFAEMDLSELLVLKYSIEIAIKIKSQDNLSTDSGFSGVGIADTSRDYEGPSLVDWAKLILDEPDRFDYSLTLADQAFLASLILCDMYQQETFSSRDINDVIKDSGRAGAANITSALSGLKMKSYLIEEGRKMLSLSPEGRKKARALIGLVRKHDLGEEDASGRKIYEFREADSGS